MGATQLFGDHVFHEHGQYTSLAEASNGRLYAAPYDALRVLEIDPALDIFTKLLS